MERTIYHVVHNPTDSCWHLEVGGKSLAGFATKDEAVHEAQSRGRTHEQNGSLAQLLIHRKDGPVQIEYRYGVEPRKRPV